MKFQLGEWTVQEDANLLTKGDVQVRVEKRIMAVLMQLVAAGGGVVSKEELLDEVWTGSVVSDHSVANAVSDLRRALGDDSRNPRYVETVPKRGYRLLVDPDHSANRAGTDPAPARPSGASTRTTVIAIGAILVFAALTLWFWPRTGSPPRLLLPDIENATGDARWDVAGETAGELLTVALAGGRFRLIRWRAGVPDDEAGVRSVFEDMELRSRDRVLEGRIVPDGDTPVLTLQLLDWTDRASVWAGAYALDDVRYGELAEAILADIREPLGLTGPPRRFASTDPATFEAYWRARYLWSLREHQSIREALRLLTDVVERAPDFAPAHAALADIYAHKTAEELGLDRWETYDMAERHLARAIAIDPNLSAAQVTRAYLSFFRDKDVDAAMSRVDRAIELRPDNAVAWQTKAMIASAAGDANTSIDAIDHARILDPLSPSMIWDRVWFLYIAGRYEDAENAAAQARRVSAPVEIYEALIDLARGDEAAALGHWLTRARSRGLSDPDSDEIEDISHSRGARAALRKLAELATGDGEYDEHPIPLAALLVALNQKDAAIVCLLSDRPREKSWWWSWYGTMSVFDEIRNDGRLRGR